MLPKKKDAAIPNTDFNGGSVDTAACEEEEVVEDQDQDKFAHSDGKGRVGKSDKLLGVALAAESTRTHEEACEDAEVNKAEDDTRETVANLVSSSRKGMLLPQRLG